jgi:hypothetical protein
MDQYLTVATVASTAIDRRKWLSDSDIVPEAYQNRLLYWSDTFKFGCFDIGDIAGDLVARAAENKFDVTQAQVFDAVGRYCGRSGRTVRYYYETSSFYPQSVRDEYDMLPFSHFVFARTMGDWRAVLEYAKEKPYITEAGLRLKFQPPLDYVASDSIDESTFNENATLRTSLSDVNEHEIDRVATEREHEHKAPFSSTRTVLTALSGFIERLQVILDSIGLKPDTEYKLVTALRIIKDSIPEIIEQINEHSEKK